MPNLQGNWQECHLSLFFFMMLTLEFSVYILKVVEGTLLLLQPAPCPRKFAISRGVAILLATEFGHVTDRVWVRVLKVLWNLAIFPCPQVLPFLT